MNTVAIPPRGARLRAGKARAHAVVDELRPGLTRISLVGADVTNVYLLGDVLLDAGGRLTAPALLRVLAERPPAAHALTHAHFDHQGGSAAVCRAFGIPLWCGEGDRAAAEFGQLFAITPRTRPLSALLNHLLSGPRYPVARVLKEGDEVGGFTVLATPGHTPGHLAYWRESDRLLVLGDVLFHRHPVTRQPGLREPFAFATWDRTRNRAAARRLAALEPALVCFGHGPPLADTARFRKFVARLP